MRRDGRGRRQNDKTGFKQQIAYYSGRNGAGDISAAYPAVRYGASDGYNPLHVYFSLIWYAAGAAVLAKSSFLPRGFIIIALLGFAGTYSDFKAAFFDRGFYNLAHDIKAFVPKDKPILAFDNNNLFCEYYLPEHTCLAIVGADGEILRRPSVMKNIALYGKEPGEVTFTLSSYGQMRNNKDCLNYKSAYRISHGTDLCKLDAAHVRQLLKESLDLRLNKYERH